MLSRTIPLLTASFIVAFSGNQSWAERLVIGAYNVENLFDSMDDSGNPRDDTYLPLSLKSDRGPAHQVICEKHNGTSGRYFDECMKLDWSEDVLEAKLSNIADVIKSIDGGNGPAVLTLQEVENPAIIERLNRDHLTNFGYNVVGFDSSDELVSRGIDVMMLTRLPIMESSAHKVSFSSPSCKPTRDILETVLELPDGTELVVYGVHFPSPSNDSICRTIVAKKLLELRDQAVTPPGNRVAVAMGDFNISCSEDARSVMRNDVLPHWLVPAGAGLSAELPSGLSDAERDAITKAQEKMRCSPPGSHFFGRDGTWSFLDLIVGSKNLRGSFQNGPDWALNLGSFRTGVFTEQQVYVDDKNRTKPNRFDVKTKTGVSDHWPVLIDLISR